MASSICCSSGCVLAAVGAALIGLGQAAPPSKIPPPSAASIQRAEQVLAAARTALGGDALAAVKTVVATGRTRRVRGNNLVPIEFELFIELPDKYVRVDEFPAEDTDPTSSGFNGDALVQFPAPPAALAQGRGPTPMVPPSAAAPAAAPGALGGTPSGGRGPAPDPRRARVTALKQDFTRLALGLFAASPEVPLTFSYAAIAEAPQGKADVLDAKGEGSFALRLFVNSETRLPVMVTWNTPPTNVIVTVPGQPPPKTVAPGAVVVEGPPPPPAGAPKEDTDTYAKAVMAKRAKAMAMPVEHRLYFADYRDVNGVRFPFRLRRAIGQETTEETTFDRFRLNAKIDPRKLEPVK